MRAHYLKLKGNVRATIYAGKQSLEFHWPEGVTLSIVSEEQPEKILGDFKEEKVEHQRGIKPKPGMEC